MSQHEETVDALVALPKLPIKLLTFFLLPKLPIKLLTLFLLLGSFGLDILLPSTGEIGTKITKGGFWPRAQFPVLPNSGSTLGVIGKRSPNPGGRLGDPITRAKTKEVINDLKSRNFSDIDTEVQFDPGCFGSGKTRYADVVGTDPITGHSEIVQIGVTIKSDPKVPVKRKRVAMDDIIFSPTIREYPRSTIRFVDKNCSVSPEVAQTAG